MPAQCGQEPVSIVQSAFTTLRNPFRAARRLRRCLYRLCACRCWSELHGLPALRVRAVGRARLGDVDALAAARVDDGEGAGARVLKPERLRRAAVASEKL